MGADDGLGILANLLALPRTLPMQQQQALGQRALYRPLVDSGVITAEQLQALAPDAPLGGHFPGADVPVLGGFLRGTGVVGQLLQTVAGSGGSQAAPRPPIAEIGAIAELQNKTRERAAQTKAAGTFTNPRARALADVGAFGPAEKAEGGFSGSTADNALLLRLETTADPEEKTRLQHVLDQSLRRKSQIAGAGAAATADVGLRKSLKEEAAKKYNQIGNAFRTVIPMMERAKSALTANPAIAGSGLQRPVLWAKALLGDEAAAAVRQLPSQAAQLARTQDVGNLNTNEQAVWHSFINGEDMTAQQFAVAIDVLKKLLMSSATYNKRVYETGELQPLEDDLGDQPTPAAPSPQSAPLHQLLDSLGVPK